MFFRQGNFLPLAFFERMDYMKASIYIRVSTAEQAAEGFSLAAQQQRCTDFIKSQGWELGEVYKDDGYSAKDLNRPSMQRLIQDVKSKKFDVLVVYRLDRLVRSVLDLHQLLNIFDEHNIMFKSVTEVFDTTTAMGRLFISIVGAMAQWERENLSERVKMGLERKFLEGKRIGGPAFGYRIDEDGKMVIDQEKAQIVRWIFNSAKKMGINKIAKILNKQGVDSPKGGNWTGSKVAYLLRNPTYTGKIRYLVNRNGYGEKETIDSNHPALISEEEYNEVQEILKKRHGGRKKAHTSDYPFSTILFCTRCGSPYSGARQENKSGVTYYYRCNGTARGICQASTVLEERLVDELLNKINLIIEESEVTLESEKEETDNEFRLKQIEAELQRIKKRRRKWQEAFANDAISLEELKERMNEEKKKEEALMEELEAFNTPSNETDVSKDEIIDALKNLKEIWYHLSRKEQKEILNMIFSRIYIKTEGERPHIKPIITDYELL